MKEDFYTTLYPGQTELDTSTSPTYKWKKVLFVVIEGQPGVIYPIQYKFMPRKQILKLKIPKTWQDYSHKLRVSVETHSPYVIN
jgi:hypothetical protein